MLDRLAFIKPHRCFAAGDAFEFRPLTLLVGDQGAGKSTLLRVMRARGSIAALTSDDGATQFYAFDFEKDSPRQSGGFKQNVSGGAYLAQVAAICSSHGESNRALLRCMDRDEPHAIHILDEPDAALSPRSCHWLAALLARVVARGGQVIAAVHNPILIASVPEVLSVEHRRWMSSNEFLESHREAKHE